MTTMKFLIPDKTPDPFHVDGYVVFRVPIEKYNAQIGVTLILRNADRTTMGYATIIGFEEVDEGVIMIYETDIPVETVLKEYPHHVSVGG
jgi:hypothetical protein